MHRRRSQLCRRKSRGARWFGDPRKFLTLHHWHRPEYGITLNGSNVSAHADQWVNAINVTQATASNQPLWTGVTLNGRQALSYDGNDFLENTSFTSAAQPRTVFIAAQVTGANAVQVLYCAAKSTPTQIVYKASNTTIGLFAGSAATTSYTVDANTHIWSAVFNGASSRYRIDGAALATLNPGTQALDSLRYGTDFPAVNYLTGLMGEVIAYNSDLPTSVQIRIEKRLGAIYGARL